MSFNTLSEVWNKTQDFLSGFVAEHCTSFHKVEICVQKDQTSTVSYTVYKNQQALAEEFDSVLFLTIDTEMAIYVQKIKWFCRISNYMVEFHYF